MKIGVKFCGGCNPRYDRRLFLERLRKRWYWHDFHRASPSEYDDVLLSLCGCKCACATISDFKRTYTCLVNEDDLDTVSHQLMEFEKGLFKMWQKEYESKKMTADEAILKMPSEGRIVIGHACGEPAKLVKALLANKTHFNKAEIVHMVAMGKSEYTRPENQAYFRHNALFVGGSTRKAVNEKRADYTPSFFYEVPRLFKEGYLPVDVALIQVSQPDAHGFCSFGVSNDYTKPAAEVAQWVIAEVNDQMPRTLGDNFIHINDIDCIVESSEAIIELPRPHIGEVEKAIGENCAKLVEDGSTLQLGIGAIPDAVLLFLKEKKNLGIHSEMFSDGVVDLYEAGVITNLEKGIHKGKMLVTFVMGTQRLYDFINDNPIVELYPVDYVNHPTVIAQNQKMVSINSCIEVDLMGQVSSESMGLKQFSGTGGQVDYVRGTSMGKDGKSIIAIPSTAKKGELSRIVPFLKEGSAITTSRNDVHYIVTEYGIADLRGKSLKQRAKALIDIAHPKFREELMQVFNQRFIESLEAKIIDKEEKI